MTFVRIDEASNGRGNAPAFRLAQSSDISDLVEMGKLFHQQSRDADLPYDVIGVAALMAALIDSPHGFVAIGEERFISGQLTNLPHLTNNVLIAVEAYWWAPTGGADLFQAFETWARSQGAQFVMASHQHGSRDKGFSRLYRRRGFDLHEVYYRKAL